ncbi:MAG TPA: DUF222 domain-containing protein, partial [Egibacteraceae bacterium]|nr:DUF222 domain-containing protein [Egibacteraceae bacterium]
MYRSAAGLALGRRGEARACVARERSATYAAGRQRPGVQSEGEHQAGWRDAGGWPGPPSLAEALDQLEAAIQSVASADLDLEDDRAVLDAAVRLQRLESRCVASQLGVVDVVARRDAFRRDGAVTAASWLRGRTGADHGAAKRRVQAAVRLRRLPELRAALEAGEVTLDHVTAITAAAVPTRMDAIADAEATLVRLAKTARPHDVRVAVRHLADQVDRDGTDAEPLPDDGMDQRRELTLTRTVDGLGELRGLLDTVTAELLATALDAVDAPDDPDTPPERRRSPAQRRHDALHELLRRTLEAGGLPTKGGIPAHLFAMADLATLAGADEAAARPPRLRYMGEISPEVARRIAR